MMEQMMNSSTLRSGAAALILTLITTILFISPVRAQDPGFPPWPIIMSGTVTLDDEALEQGSLTAKIGDWTSAEVPVVKGVFNCTDPCLILGPPSFDYIGSDVSFHLSGINKAAELSFEFPNLAAPERRRVTVEFTTGIALGPIWIGLTALLALAIGVTVLALMFRRELGNTAS